MKGLILVGGYGTRLRPLTLTKPKPLVEFANRPMILHQVEALADAGVKDIVLAVNYRPEVMVETLKQYEKEYDVSITFSVETEPLGTAGPLRLAEDVLRKDDSPFFVLNSDVICNYPFKELIEYHRAHGGEGTIVATKVEDPSKYGVIQHKPGTAQIERFVEKPVAFVGNRINAGIYILNPSVIDLIELRPTSIEKETFPKLAERGTLYSYDLEGYWMDVGQPKDFLAGMGLYLNALAQHRPELLVDNANEYLHTGNIMVHPTAKVSPTAKLGPSVVIGPNATIGDGARISRSVIMSDAVVKPHAHVRQSIVGWGSKVGSWARVENVTVLGDDVEIKDEIYVNGGRILPHKSISANVEKPEIIM